MEDSKLPNMSRIRDGNKQKSDLPPQNSADDTSNWNDRAFTAPDVKGERKVVLSIPPVEKVTLNPYLAQQKVKDSSRSKKGNI